MTTRALRVACATLLVATASPAWAEPSVVGAWNLVSYAREDPATGAATFPWARSRRACSCSSRTVTWR